MNYTAQCAAAWPVLDKYMVSLTNKTSRPARCLHIPGAAGRPVFRGLRLVSPGGAVGCRGKGGPGALGARAGALGCAPAGRSGRCRLGTGLGSRGLGPRCGRRSEGGHGDRPCRMQKKGTISARCQARPCSGRGAPGKRPRRPRWPRPGVREAPRPPAPGSAPPGLQPLSLLGTGAPPAGGPPGLSFSGSARVSGEAAAVPAEAGPPAQTEGGAARVPAQARAAEGRARSRTSVTAASPAGPATVRRYPPKLWKMDSFQLSKDVVQAAKSWQIGDLLSRYAQKL